jgi:hypothetical protein
MRAFRDCEGDTIVAKVRKNYKVSTRPPATLPLSLRVLICICSYPVLTAQLTSSRVLMTIFRVCGNGDMVVVSQNEEISTRAPRFCVAYQAPHAVAGDGTYAVARRSTPSGRRRRNPRGRRRRNPRSCRRRIPCGRRRPARARVRRGRCPSSLTPRARPSANGSARSARRR